MQLTACLTLSNRSIVKRICLPVKDFSIALVYLSLWQSCQHCLETSWTTIDYSTMSTVILWGRSKWITSSSLAGMVLSQLSNCVRATLTSIQYQISHCQRGVKHSTVLLSWKHIKLRSYCQWDVCGWIHTKRSKCGRTTGHWCQWNASVIHCMQSQMWRWWRWWRTRRYTERRQWRHWRAKNTGWQSGLLKIWHLVMVEAASEGVVFFSRQGFSPHSIDQL